MRQQRNRFHMKEQDKTSEEKPSEVEVSNLSHKRVQDNDDKDAQRIQKRMNKVRSFNKVKF